VHSVGAVQIIVHDAFQRQVDYSQITLDIVCDDIGQDMQAVTHNGVNALNLGDMYTRKDRAYNRKRRNQQYPLKPFAS